MKSITNARQHPEPSRHIPGFPGDRVMLFLAVAFGVLLVADRTQAYLSLRFTAQSMLGIAPFFIIALAFAGYAKATGADKLIARAFSGNPMAAVLGASLAGALSPFCSCGVIPLIAAMLASGVPLAPVMAFCIASPIMDPEMFVLTAAGINLNFALAKTVAAIVMGLGAGICVLLLRKRGFFLNPLKKSQSCGCGSPKSESDAGAGPVWRFWRWKVRREIFTTEVIKAGGFLGKWMLLAFFLESLMLAYIPTEYIANLVGNKNTFAIPLAAIIGIPAYMNGYAAIPLVAGLMEMGMTPGAAMTFVIAGAVSSIPAALAVFALVKKPVFVLYLVWGVAGSILAGTIYQLSGVF
jgi:uncharacterized protein